MANKREYAHTVDTNGKPVVIEIPEHLRGRSEYDSGTYTENVIARRAAEAAGAAWRGLFGRNPR